MYNGVFNTWEDVLNFYNEQNADGVIPEVAENVNNDELRSLSLSVQEKNRHQRRLKTLSDGYTK